MSAWEYHLTAIVGTNQDWQELINGLGGDGWELVSEHIFPGREPVDQTDSRVYEGTFKRPKV